MAKAYHLPLYDFHRLDGAAWYLFQAFGTPPYLVGSALTRADYRDVDVRLILDDDEFDALFKSNEKLWAFICRAITGWLRAETGLPIDFQIQRQTEANERHNGSRNALGILDDIGGTYASGGDGTDFRRSSSTEDTA